MSIADLSLPEVLSSLVKNKFEAAQAGQELIFSETRLAIVHVDNIPFQLRFCPALSKKPVKSRLHQHPCASTLPPQHDPFENPSNALLIARVPVNAPSHTLVLNRYPVIPRHFILATIPYKQQTQLLEAEDLQVTYACLKAWEANSEAPNSGRRLFAFFNSGLHSGASQGHRHIQFLPVEEMVAETTWKPLIELMEEPNSQGPAKRLPFTHFHASIPEDHEPSGLLDIYISLYQKARSAEHKFFGTEPETTSSNQKAAAISYNLAMTTKVMAICPRRSEGAPLSDDALNRDPKSREVALNGTLLAGALMVKVEDDWDQLRKDPGQLLGLLRSVGVPPDRK